MLYRLTDVLTIIAFFTVLSTKTDPGGVLRLWECASCATIEVMRRAFASTDDRLLSWLQAPPDLIDGMQSLSYWRERRQRLAWYRVGARREATRMILRWEHRVRDAMLSQRGVPIAVRTSAGLLVARSRLWRWSRRAAIAVTTAVAVTVMAAPAIAVVVMLAHVL